MSPASTTSTEQARAPGLFPLVLRLSGARCLVVGGGAVAARKVEALLHARAEVTVVAPRIGQEMERLLANQSELGEPQPGDSTLSGRLTWIDRPFEEGDVAGQLLLVAATDDREVNRRASAAARRSAVLANVVDDLEASDFLVPSVMERGSLQIAVSTSGQAPALAASLRRRLEQIFPEEWSEVVEAVGASRQALLAAQLDSSECRRVNSEIAALDFGRLLEDEGMAGVRAALAALLPVRDPHASAAAPGTISGGRP